MANWCFVNIAVVGPDAERLFTLNDRKGLASDDQMVLRSGLTEDHPRYHNDYLRSMDGFVPARDASRFGSHVRKLYGVTPTVQLYGERKYGPGYGLVGEWSERFPDLIFWVEYDVEGDWRHRVLVVVAGQWQLKEKHVDWFEGTPYPGDRPVHHYVFPTDKLDPDDVQRLKAEGVLFVTSDTTEVRDGLVATRRDPVAELSVDPECVLAYTLEESWYLRGFEDEYGLAEARRVALCARPIELTGDEIGWLKRRLPAEVAAQCERFNVWTTGEALELLLDPNAPCFHWDDDPYSRARRAEIEAALKQPPWATTWPEWQAALDRLQADLGYEPQAGGMRLPEEAEAEAEAGRRFLEELRRMPADPEA
jgi:hypothetical protein